jgi:hypothetical protein
LRWPLVFLFDVRARCLRLFFAMVEIVYRNPNAASRQSNAAACQNGIQSVPQTQGFVRAAHPETAGAETRQDRLGALSPEAAAIGRPIGVNYWQDVKV